MFRRLLPGMLLLGGVSIGMALTGRMALRAQDPGKDRPTGPAPAASVQEALLRPFRFSFNRPTSLAQVGLHLKQALGISVVLDVAALERQDVQPEDTVQLDLDGVRLKTGLKLLLDQVDLTYRVVPEDNLLIITDREGADDPLDRIWVELKALHRDLHEVQDAVDELSDALYADEEEGPQVRKPTIIEEKPDDQDPNAGAKPPGHASPKGQRGTGEAGPDGRPRRSGDGHGQGSPSRRSRVAHPAPSRVPL